jgi:hypothetical protein
MSLLSTHFALSTTLSFLKLVQFSTTSSFSIWCRFDFESLMKSSMISFHLLKFYYYCNKFYLKNLWSNNVLKNFMIEKYFNKNIDDKKLIFIKFNLNYWFEYWLFDVLQLTNIEIYLYFTIYEMNNFDVEFDSYLNCFHVVRWISRDKTFRKSFNKTFVLRSFTHFVIRSLRIWHSRWINEFDWSKISWDYRASLLDLKEAMRWLSVTYSYSKRERNTMSYFWKNFFLIMLLFALISFISFNSTFALMSIMSSKSKWLYCLSK